MVYRLTILVKNTFMLFLGKRAININEMISPIQFLNHRSSQLTICIVIDAFQIFTIALSLKILLENHICYQCSNVSVKLFIHYFKFLCEHYSGTC